MKKKTKTKNNDKNLMTFDVYFSMLCNSNPNIKIYHKKAMELFFKDKMGLIATKDDFDKIFEQY